MDNNPPLGSVAETQDSLLSELFCDGLPTKFNPDLGRILVTGASGYIGGRLVHELLARGYKVRVMVRAFSPEYSRRWPAAEVAVADALKKDGLDKALENIDTAYYLIHSMNLGPDKFATADIKAAENFRFAASEMRLKRIIYLGALGDIRSSLSSHLYSRAMVAKELNKGDVPVTILRAAVIVGSGSASYEIIQHLVRKFRVMLIPPWAQSKCQPIAIRDVIKYLAGALEATPTIGRSFDIGGKEILTYEMMLKTLAGLLNRKIICLRLRFFSIRAYAYVVSLVTPVPSPIVRCLMEGLKNEVVCQNEDIRAYIPFNTLSYKQAILNAMSREEQDRVSTRWSDAYPPASELAISLDELKPPPKYSVSYFILTEKSAGKIFNSICKIGGNEGWFNNNWLWRLRGKIDRIFFGVGSVRGRRSRATLKVNDVIDFWRIEDVEDNKRLLLRAEMRLPGKAWLEFNINSEADNKRKLTITAYFDSRGIFGTAYWYFCLPFHYFIFHKLIKDIEKAG